MSKSTFILLNNRSAWVGVGESGERPQLKSLQRIDLSDLTTVEEQAAALTEALSQQRLSRKGVLLVLGPQFAEYRPFQVPPAGPAELPTIVANLASTQMTKIGENSIIDFASIPLSSSGAGTTVFVSATSFNTQLLLDELRSKGLTCDRIVPRVVLPGMLADAGSTALQVMIYVMGSEIDFVATQGPQLVMVHSSVLPIEGDQRASLIARETTRSLAVLEAEYGRAERMPILVAATDIDRQSVEQAAAAREHQVVAVAADQYGSVSESATGEYQSYQLLAMAALRTNRKPLIDFANPTQAPKDHSIRRKAVLVAALATTFVLGLVGIGWLNLSKLDRQLRDLEDDVANLEVAEPTNTATLSRIGLVNDFVRMDVRSLQVWDQLTSQLPAGEEVRLQSMKFNVGRVGANEAIPVSITARVADRSLVEKVRPTLQGNEGWELEATSNISKVAKSEYYNHSVQENLAITPDFEAIYEQLARAIDAASEGSAEQETAESDSSDSNVSAAEQSDSETDLSATDDEISAGDNAGEEQEAMTEDTDVSTDDPTRDEEGSSSDNPRESDLENAGEENAGDAEGQTGESQTEEDASTDSSNDELNERSATDAGEGR